MALTPLSTPLKTEYKPLGLEAFAAPLSQMQAKFDVAKNQIEDTEFALSRLAQDDERAKELLSGLNEQTSELADNLMKTGNYRQATQKLKELNKFYAKNAEIQGIKSNYDKFQKSLAEMEKARVSGKEGKTYTKKDIELWKQYTLGKYKGAQYDPNTGTYTSIDATPKMFDAEEQIRKEALNLVTMSAKDQLESLSRMGLSGSAKTTIESRLRDKATGALNQSEIEAFLRTSSKYRDFLDEEGKMEFFVQDNASKQSQDPFAFEDSIAERGIQYYNSVIEGFTADQQANGTDRSAEINKAIENRNNLINAANNKVNDPETYQNLTEKIYRDSKQGYLNQVARTSADIVDYRNIGLTNLEESAGSKKSKKVLEEQDDMGNIYAKPSAFTPGGQPIESGIATAATETLEAAGLETPDLVEDIRNNIEIEKEKLLPLFNQNVYTSRGTIYKTSDKLPASVENDVEINTLLKRNETLENRKTELNNENADLKNKISNPNLSQQQRDAAQAELNSKNRELNNLKIAESDQLRVLNNSVQTTMTAFLKEKPADLDDATYRAVKDLWSKNKNNTVKFLKEVNNYQNPIENLQNKLVTFDEVLAKVEQENPMAVYKYRQNLELVQQPDAMYTEDTNKMILDFENSIRLRVDEENKGFVLEANKNYTTKFVNDILDGFNRSLTIDNPSYKVAPTVTLDETADKFAKGEYKKLFENYKTELTPDSRGYQTVSINKENETTTENVGYSNFDPLLYNFDKPEYIGKFPDSNGVLREVYKLQRDIDFTGNSKDQLYRKWIKSGMPPSVTEEYKEKIQLLSDSDKKTLQKRNPSSVLISNITNKTPTVQIKETVEEQIEATLSLPMDQGQRQDRLQKTLNNYAYFHLIDNPERSTNYVAMSSALQDAARDGVNLIHTQTTPANVNYLDAYGNNRSFTTEYEVSDGQIYITTREFRTDKNGNPATVNGITYPKDGRVVGSPRKPFTFQDNLPLAILKQDMIYGTGRAEDIFSIRGEAIIPAYQVDNYSANY